MAFIRALRWHLSLVFAVMLQVLQFLHGWSWWTLFSGLGVWTLAVPVSTTYGGAAMVIHDGRKGYQYSSDWARIFTAAFLSFFFTLSAVSLAAVALLVLAVCGVMV